MNAAEILGRPFLSRRDGAAYPPHETAAELLAAVGGDFGAEVRVRILQVEGGPVLEIARIGMGAEMAVRISHPAVRRYFRAVLAAIAHRGTTGGGKSGAPYGDRVVVEVADGSVLVEYVNTPVEQELRCSAVRENQPETGGILSGNLVGAE